MNDTFDSKGGEQNIAQGDHAISKQENTTQPVSGDGCIFSATGNVTVNQGLRMKPSTVVLASVLAAAVLGASLAGWHFLAPPPMQNNGIKDNNNSGPNAIAQGSGATVNQTNNSGVPPEVLAKYAGKLAVIESALKSIVEKQQVPLSVLDSKLFRINLGISCANQRITRELDLQGVLVLSVEPGSSAAKAGIRGTRQVRDGIILGDIISGVNTVQIQDFNQFQDEIEKHNVGETITLILLREDGPVDVEVTIEVALKDI